MSTEIEIPLLEELADQEHKSWANWAQYELDQVEKELAERRKTVVDASGRLEESALDAFRALACVQRWRRQIKTPYAELTPYAKLSEKEKESDRKVVRKKYDLFRKSALSALEDAPGGD